MKYWFKSSKFRLDQEYVSSSGKLKTLKIKKDTFRKAERLAKYLSNQSNLSELKPYWTTINTFGWVFCDFEPERTGSALIGGGAKRLADLAKDDFKYIILSRKIEENVIPLPDKEILLINILFFKEFISTFSNPAKRVELFLYKLPENELGIIKRWIRGRPQNLQREDSNIATTEVMQLLEQNRDFFKIVGNTEMAIKSIKKSYIIKNHETMREDLEKFKKMIEGRELEIELNRFLVERPWIISFDYSFMKSERKGKFDMHIFEKKWNPGRDIVIELKKADKKVSKKYSSHEVISMDTAVAISQCINYLEENKNIFEKGIVILGREKNEAVARMNKYLHNIDLLTYDSLYDKAKRVLDFLEEQYMQNTNISEEDNEERDNLARS